MICFESRFHSYICLISWWFNRNTKKPLLILFILLFVKYHFNSWHIAFLVCLVYSLFHSWINIVITNPIYVLSVKTTTTDNITTINIILLLIYHIYFNYIVNTITKIVLANLKKWWNLYGNSLEFQPIINLYLSISLSICLHNIYNFPKIIYTLKGHFLYSLYVSNIIL